MKRRVFLNDVPNVSLYSNETNGNNCSCSGTCNPGNGATCVIQAVCAICGLLITIGTMCTQCSGSLGVDSTTI